MYAAAAMEEVQERSIMAKGSYWWFMLSSRILLQSWDGLQDTWVKVLVCAYVKDNAYCYEPPPRSPHNATADTNTLHQLEMLLEMVLRGCYWYDESYLAHPKLSFILMLGLQTYNNTV